MLVRVNEATLRLSGSDMAHLGQTVEGVLDPAREEIATRLQALRGVAERTLGRAVGLTILGRPTDQIARLVRAGSYQLLVIGPHRRTGMRRFLRGSAAEEVLHSAKCPFLLVPEALATVEGSPLACRV
ncbi:MAG TPA: universal stress protein [Anaeromyxobacteraceae bacterium]|nr:universal stress protein [Anaeromyxobacteraceae bacterium]